MMTLGGGSELRMIVHALAPIVRRLFDEKTGSVGLFSQIHSSAPYDVPAR